MNDLQDNIEARLRELDPAIELVAFERPRTDALRLYVDHPEGVTLGRCEQVTNHLRDLLSEYSLEVSSPGDKRRQPTPVPETKEQLQ
jgi:ribosome maturation factor RimP